MSTRVLPDPAGATTRAGPAPWATAASWSAANAAFGVTAAGTTDSTPASTDSPCTTTCAGSSANGARGPPSTHAAEPSGNRMSAGPSGVASARSSSRAALTAHHHTGVSVRASYVFAHTRKCSRSYHGSASAASRHGSTANDCGWRKRCGSTARATTIGSRDAHAAWSRRTVSPGASSTASSTVTTGASVQGAGGANPAWMTTPRPRIAGPGAGTIDNLRRGCQRRAVTMPTRPSSTTWPCSSTWSP